MAIKLPRVLTDHYYFHLLNLVGTIFTTFVAYLVYHTKAEPILMGRLIKEILTLGHNPGILIICTVLAVIGWALLSVGFNYTVVICDEQSDIVGWGFVFMLLNGMVSVFFVLLTTYLSQVVSGFFGAF